MGRQEQPPWLVQELNPKRSSYRDLGEEAYVCGNLGEEGLGKSWICTIGTQFLSKLHISDE
jgi:hypothetical protein